MGGILVNNSVVLPIQSYRGIYEVHFGVPFAGLREGLKEKEYLVIDRHVADLYAPVLAKAMAESGVLSIEATEENKSLEKIPEYVMALTRQGIKRGCTLVAVGGGVIQDIVAFIAEVLFRGLSWRFYPTTLLAQADSCIGSKSSINVGGFKNQVGTLTPPNHIHISSEVLETLSDADFRSGIGEMIKVHLIAGKDDFEKIQNDFPRLKNDRGVLLQTIYRSLEIKKGFIEKDEFDRKERLLLNFGHSFGHAIESATQYQIPHGIAVTIGLDMAYFFSWQFNLLPQEKFLRVHPLLKKNSNGFEAVKIPFERFLTSIRKDKKNLGSRLSLVLTRGPGRIFQDFYPDDACFQKLCTQYFKEWRV